MATPRLSPNELERLLAACTTIQESPLMEADTAFLQQLSTIDRELLHKLMAERHYGPGEIVFQEGDPGDAACLIRSGRVIVAKGNLDNPTILGCRGPGAFVGEMALLEEKPRSASIIALEDVRLLMISRADFDRLLGIESLIGLKIIDTLSARLRQADTVRATEIVSGRRLARQVSKLQQEKEQLQELERVRQETSDLIIHDLRSPLSSIRAALQMLQIMLPGDTLAANQEVMDIAITSCTSMQRLVDSLLEVTRLEAGEGQLELAEVDLGQLVRQALQQAALAAQVGDVSLQKDLPGGPTPVRVDAGMIERVLNNLIDNAIRYGPPRTSITVAVEPRKDCVAVSVTDAGPGILPEERERIFERFAQAGGGKGIRGRRGFGLGLTFCRLAVRAHGGHIWVEPGPGGAGSRFVFTLPPAGERDSLPTGK